MSAKITVIVYILICFEVGILLLILPRTQLWDDNFFLFFLAGKLNASWLPGFVTSGAVRGVVMGLGTLNILAGIWDIYKFRESVSRLTASTTPLPPEEEKPFDSAVVQPAAALSDHQPPRIPPQ
jgi:hypothetical protein